MFRFIMNNTFENAMTETTTTTMMTSTTVSVKQYNAYSWFEQVVNGAPTSVAFNPFDVFSSFDDFRTNIQCIYNVVDEVMDESKADDLWHDAKIQLKSIVEVEWQNCLEMDDNAEQEK